ncbi:MAG: carbon storage regulator [Alphaproteobacteria bacterium]|nr:carbon storage regulator [Alphaproteobacteria bacterium]
MLYIKRKIGESVVINDTIKVKVSEIQGKTVKLEFDFPKDNHVLRSELYDRIKQENQDAVANPIYLEELLK